MFVIFALKDPSNNGVPKVRVLSPNLPSNADSDYRVINGFPCVFSSSSSDSDRASAGKQGTPSTSRVTLPLGSHRMLLGTAMRFGVLEGTTSG
jgi:hypothetical protein